MASLLIQDLQQGALARLEDRASRHGQSLQKEVKAILEDVAADQEALRAWGMKMPIPPEEPCLYGQETGLQDWRDFQPWSGKR